MSLILHIDTSVSVASIALAKKGLVLTWDKHTEREENGWLHSSIPRLLSNSSYSMKDLGAIAVSIGPGSYTGLRVGLSAAKGLCFALNIPLITINTLQMMASAVVEETEEGSLICPMIDARRMEVFTAIYDKSLEEVFPSSAIVLDEHFLQQKLLQQKIVFCGNALEKLKPLISSADSFFIDKQADARDLCKLACQKFVTNEFADLAYCEPLYIKEFFSPSSTSL